MTTHGRAERTVGYFVSAQKDSKSRRPRVVVLGGGFGGVGAALKLGKSDVDVVLGDKHDDHTGQPVL